MKQPNSDMSGKICMVTGANTGIGKATAHGLAALGASVIMICRNQSKGEEARADIISESGNKAVDLMIADLASQESIHRLAQDFKDRNDRLDVLVNNAGVILRERTLTADGIETTFAVNHLGPFLLTNLLLDNLKAAAPSRIVTVSSKIHSRSLDFDNIQGEKHYGATEAYSQSKLENVLFTYELARHLEGTGVTANCLHPGVVGTNLMNGFFPLLARPLAWLVKPLLTSPETGAETSIYLASSPEVEDVTGKYFMDKKETSSSSGSYDREAAARLWQMSAALTHMAG